MEEFEWSVLKLNRGFWGTRTSLRTDETPTHCWLSA